MGKPTDQHGKGLHQCGDFRYQIDMVRLLFKCGRVCNMCKPPKTLLWSCQSLGMGFEELRTKKMNSFMLHKNPTAVVSWGCLPHCETLPTKAVDVGAGPHYSIPATNHDFLPGTSKYVTIRCNTGSFGKPDIWRTPWVPRKNKSHSMWCDLFDIQFSPPTGQRRTCVQRMLETILALGPMKIWI